MIFVLYLLSMLLFAPFSSSVQNIFSTLYPALTLIVIIMIKMQIYRRIMNILALNFDFFSSYLRFFLDYQ